MTTVIQLKAMSSNTTVTNVLRVKVTKVSDKGWVSYDHGKGLKRKLDVMLADETDFIKCTIYNETLSEEVKEGNSIAVRNFTIRNEMINFNNQTRIYSQNDIVVPDDILTTSVQAIHLPIHPVSPIKQIKDSQEGQKVSFNGRVVADELPHPITTKDGRQISVREIQVSDGTDIIATTLWKDATLSPLKTGSKVLVKDVKVARSAFHKNEMVAAVNYRDEIEIIPEMEKEEKMIATALSKHTKDEVLLLVEHNDADVEYSVDLPLLLSALGENTLKDVITRLPFVFEGTIVDGRITVMRPIDDNPEDPKDSDNEDLEDPEDPKEAANEDLEDPNEAANDDLEDLEDPKEAANEHLQDPKTEDLDLDGDDLTSEAGDAAV